MILVDGKGTPLGAYLELATLAEVNLLKETLAKVPDKQGKKIKHLILDRGYNSNPLRERLAEDGIELIIPARSNHKKATHQVSRKLQRYKHRWIVEQFAWLGWFRRLMVR